MYVGIRCSDDHFGLDDYDVLKNSSVRPSLSNKETTSLARIVDYHLYREIMKHKLACVNNQSYKVVAMYVIERRRIEQYQIAKTV